MELVVQILELTWWTAIAGSLMLMFLDAVLAGVSEDRNYNAMHARMKFAIYFMVVGIVAKAAKFLA